MRTPQRVDDRIHDRRAGPDSTCLAGSLNIERIVHATNAVRLELDCRHLVGPRHRVVHQARGHELPGSPCEELNVCFGTAPATSLLVSLGQCARSWRSLSPHDTRSCSGAPVALLDADLGAELTDQRAHLFRRAALPLHRRW